MAAQVTAIKHPTKNNGLTWFLFMVLLLSFEVFGLGASCSHLIGRETEKAIQRSAKSY
jgi:hypothetical protein